MLRAATRGSPLARWQTDRVASLLGVPVEVIVVQTEGDRRRDVPIDQIGGRGVFVKEVQAAVLDGRADIAVHSAKDLPSSPGLQPAGLTLACIPERADPRDCLVGGTLDGLPVGALVATGSTRRRAQLAALRPDLTFTGLRGNIDTRLAKAASGEVDAVVMAYAALERLGRTDAVTEVLDAEVMVPQVAQGALAVECRENDERTLELLAAIDDADAHANVDCERSFLATLGGACDLPVGALASEAGTSISALLATADGRIVLRDRRRGSDPIALGHDMASRLLDEAGGAALLDP